MPDGAIGISVDETTSADDVRDILAVFGASRGGQTPGRSVSVPCAESCHEGSSGRSAFLTHPVFNTHHSETKMMRYISGLERKDVGLDTSMIPLGSCTMKLNAASEMIPVTWPAFSRMHPFAPVEQARGLSADLRASSNTRSAGSPALRRCRCSRTPARRGSSPA